MKDILKNAVGLLTKVASPEESFYQSVDTERQAQVSQASNIRQSSDVVADIFNKFLSRR